MDVVHQLCRGLFAGVHGYQELVPVFRHIFQEAVESQSSEHEIAAQDSHMLWSALASNYSAIKKRAKQHPNGPLEQVLEIFEYGTYHVFDPVGQGNIPYQNYSLFFDHQKMTNIRMPSPTTQEFIHKASILDEFKGFLRSYLQSQLQRKHLMINLQDKTSWKEHARSLALEELQTNTPFSEVLEVVTLSKDSEFYHQIAPYNEDNHADVFIEQFIRHLGDENCGFHFSMEIKKRLFSGFIEGVIQAVHQIFFGDMNVLTLDNRKDFIEVFYMFLQLKLIDLVKPDSFSFTCKDGIDSGGTTSAQLYAFLTVLNKNHKIEKEKEHIDFILHIAPIIFRERTILPERFERMIQAIKRVETIKQERGAEEFNKMIRESIGKYYDSPILESVNLVPVL